MNRRELLRSLAVAPVAVPMVAAGMVTRGPFIIGADFASLNATSLWCYAPGESFTSGFVMSRVGTPPLLGALNHVRALEASSEPYDVMAQVDADLALLCEEGDHDSTVTDNSQGERSGALIPNTEDGVRT